METSNSFTDCLAIVVSAIAIGLSYWAYIYSKSVASTQLYISLRSRYLQIHEELPDDLRKKDWIPVKDSSDWRSIERYWYVSFDEWFSTKKIKGRVNDDLWNQFYSHAIKSSLANNAMRVVLIDMLQGHVSFGSFKDEFRRELTSLYLELYPSLTSLEQIPNG